MLDQVLFQCQPRTANSTHDGADRYIENFCCFAVRHFFKINQSQNLPLPQGEEFNREMIVRGSLERLVPVLMTALTAGLALIPLALSKGQAGKEILYPVATVVLGGLLTTTLLDMLVTPAVFWLFGRPAAEQAMRQRVAVAGAVAPEHVA